VSSAVYELSKAIESMFVCMPCMDLAGSITVGAWLHNKTNNSGQVVRTHVPLSASSIIWYRPKGGDVLRLDGKRGPGGK